MSVAFFAFLSFFLFTSDKVPQWLIKATILVAWFTLFIVIQFASAPQAFIDKMSNL